MRSMPVRAQKEGRVSTRGSGALTYVWNRIDGDWKIVHIHESTK